MTTPRERAPGKRHSGARRKLAPNIYADASGISIIVQVRGVQKEIREPLETDLDTLKQRRDQFRADLHEDVPRVEPGTLAADAERYLTQISGRPGSAADRSHLRAWLDVLGPRKRHKITAGDVRMAFARWREVGQHRGGRGSRTRTAIDAPASEKTLKERWRVLKHLYKTLDGPKAKTPCDDVEAPKPAASVPTGIPIETIRTVAANLRARARRTKTTSRKQRDLARFLLLATTGQRPVQVMRARPEDFTAETWLVRGAKGEPAHRIFLNDDQRAAVAAFLKADAFGSYSTSQLVKVAREAGWPAGVRLYAARHSIAIDALDRGADLGDVQGLLGHTQIETTRRFYGPILTSRQKAVSVQLQGRFGSVLQASAPKRGRQPVQKSNKNRQVTTRARYVKSAQSKAGKAR